MHMLFSAHDALYQLLHWVFVLFCLPVCMLLAYYCTFGTNKDNNNNICRQTVYVLNKTHFTRLQYKAVRPLRSRLLDRLCLQQNKPRTIKVTRHFANMIRVSDIAARRVTEEDSNSSELYKS